MGKKIPSELLQEFKANPDGSPPAELKRHAQEVIDNIQAHVNDARARLAAGEIPEIMLTYYDDEKSGIHMVNLNKIGTLIEIVENLLDSMPTSAAKRALDSTAARVLKGMTEGIANCPEHAHLKGLFEDLQKKMGEQSEGGQESFDFETIKSDGTKH